MRYFGYFEVYVPNSEDLHANETVSGGKIEKAESVPKRMNSSTGFNEMQKIMGFRKKVSSVREWLRYHAEENFNKTIIEHMYVIALNKLETPNGIFI